MSQKKQNISNLTPAEIYAHEFQFTEPKYYTRIPNIIDHLTYKDEKGNCKRLSVYAKELYRVIRMIASDHGIDFHTTQSLADLIGCSVGSVVNAKEELLKPMHQLDGSPLIIENRKQIKKIIQEKVVKTIICTRTIVNIWPWNNGYMATLKHQKLRPHSPYECDNPPDSSHESGPERPHSPGEANNNTNNNNPLSLEQQPTAEAALSVFQKKKEQLFLSSDKKKAFEHLMKIGYTESIAYDFCLTWSFDDLCRASEYFASQINRNKAKNSTMTNKCGYFRNILQNRYWEKART